ncbi:hypothetical protein JP74_23430, partial [Devosia sp. 17-2-E-8]
AIAGEMVATTEGDGYTLLTAASSVFSVMPHLNPQLPWKPLDDLTPVVMFGVAPLVIGVPPDSPYNTLEELVAAAKEQPGDLTVGSFSLALGNLAALLLNEEAGIDLTFVGFGSSAELLTAAMSGEIDVIVNGIGPMLPLFAAGSLKPIAVTNTSRYETLPDTPTVSETFPNYDAASWFGIFGPANMDEAARDTIASAVERIVEKPEIREQLLGLGAVVDVKKGADFADLVRTDFERFGALIEKIPH